MLWATLKIKLLGHLLGTSGDDPLHQATWGWSHPGRTRIDNQDQIRTAWDPSDEIQLHENATLNQTMRWTTKVISRLSSGFFIILMMFLWCHWVVIRTVGFSNHLNQEILLHRASMLLRKKYIQRQHWNAGTLLDVPNPVCGSVLLICLQIDSLPH